jgi:ubiquinone/menaquinone biosynthesis C-methylase UbiE
MDARKLVNVATHSIDLVHSNNTFEHVYPEILKDILREFARVTKKEGLQSHFIDMSDHFAHFDKSITIYNFLKYSCKTWDKIIDNNVQPQNRWRFAQFINLYHHLDIPVSDSIVRKGDLEALKTVKIHSEWKQYSSEELAISHCYIFSKMDDRISLTTDEIRT